ncbi:MAG TPA: hypothetical protein VGB37_00360 [Candidatus Lokiarchaeia archaeon]
MKINDIESLKELTPEQRKEVWYKEILYGTVYIIKYKNGKIEIKGVNEINEYKTRFK